MGTRAKYWALIFGTTVTAFLVNFAKSFLCGMMTLSFALIAENPTADVWVMDGGVQFRAPGRWKSVYSRTQPDHANRASPPASC